MAQTPGKLIMVCGAARSGTTMLDLMLGNADNAFSTGEIFAHFRPYRQHHFEPACSCGDKNCDVWSGLLGLPESELHATILARPEYDFVIDSSKDLRWVLDSNNWARAHGIPCYNIVLYKNPIDLAYSYWKRGHDITWYRRVFLVYYGRFLKLGLPFVSVDYSKLADDPASMLEKLCRYFDMPFDSNRMNFWEKRHHHFFGSAGTARQVNKGGSSVRKQEAFPDEFLEAYTAESEWAKQDRRFSALIDALRANDISIIGQPVAANAEPYSGVKPLWYYRHVIKSAWRRYFPERGAVAD